MYLIKTFILVNIFCLFSVLAKAGAVDGKWLFHKDNADNLDRALNISGSSFISLIITSEGAAYESGWWTENSEPNAEGKTSVIVCYGDNPPDTIFYRLENQDNGIIWLEGEPQPWGTMARMNCDLSLQYRNKSDPAPEGCAWLHIRGWGYSGLDGECIYSEDWVNSPADNNNPMECLIEAPAKFVQ
jgi:hypothetical protein